MKIALSSIKKAIDKTSKNTMEDYRFQVLLGAILDEDAKRLTEEQQKK